jgi:hypothetical protein
MAKLDDDKIAWIIKSKSQARLTNRDIADAANVSISRVQQMYRIYKRSNSIPKLKKSGRKRKEITEEGGGAEGHSVQRKIVGQEQNKTGGRDMGLSLGLQMIY